MKKPYRKIKVLTNRFVSDLEKRDIDVMQYINIVIYSAAYEFGLSFKASKRIVNHVLAN